MSYRIVPRTEIGLPAEVRGSNGMLRPPLAGERYMTAHYTGVNATYALRDVAAEVLRIQIVFSTTKPFEYNYVIGAAEDNRIYEFAGKYQAAHSEGENGDSFGVLFLLGQFEPVSSLMIDKWRWLRDVLVYDGSLAPNVDQRQHFQMPGAATACAGASIRSRWSEFLTPWVAPAPPPTTTPEDDDMPPYIVQDTALAGACFLPDGTPLSMATFVHLRDVRKVPVIAQDHAHWRETILHKMGPTARALYGR